MEAETLELLTPREAYDIASQWGSFITNGDPGAAFYTFRNADATPQGPNHRAQLLAYTVSLLEGETLEADDRADLESLKAFFERFPDSGEETREAYADESAAIIAAADDFSKAYFTAALFTGVEHPEGHPDADHDKRYDLDPSDIHPDALRNMLAETAQFQEAAADLLTEAYTRDGYGGGEWSAEAQAGHDFWLTRNGHGAGFWDRSALDADGLGDKLSDAARKFGESNLYTADDGAIREM